MGHVNKVSHVFTLSHVAEMLGEDEEWLFEVAEEMDTEDGQLWVVGVGEDGVMAFTDDGIENLKELIAIHKETPSIIEKRRQAPLLFSRAVHPASPRASSPAFVADKLLARNLHPSTSTGNPRTTQKTPVIHASVCAPARIAACMSRLTGPSSATGPLVNANSNPR